ncbi:MAG: hypothetical protein JW739_06100 [Opitutales bacterium]|nr:hypothetical protein [Opitutales bacterium]
MNRKVTGILAIAIIFTMGMVSGWSVHSTVQHLQQKSKERPLPFELNDRKLEDFISHCTNELQLTPDQQEKLRIEAREAQKKFRAFFEQNRPVMEQLIKECEDSIAAILNEEQQIEFTKFKERQRKLIGMRPPERHPKDDFIKENDQDGDGMLSKEEVPDFMLMDFDQVDKDGDGQITQSEIWERMRQMRPRDGGPIPLMPPPPLPPQE